MTKITLHGVIFPTDTMNSNGRVYTKEAIENAIKDIDKHNNGEIIHKDIE